MRGPSDRDLDLLLARGKMSGAARERVLENVLRGARPRGLRVVVWAPGLAMIAAAAAIIVWVRPADDGFRSKGSTGGAAVGLDVVCLEGPCRERGTLVFRVDDVPESAHLAAYATREGDPSMRIWYFPEADGWEPTLAAQPGSQVVPRAITLGPEHKPGRYVVRVVVGRHPLTREAALNDANPEVIARATRAFEIVP